MKFPLLALALSSFTFGMKTEEITDKCSNEQVDILKNGNFQQNCCTSLWCLWNQKTYDQSRLPGWLPAPSVQIGRGYLYNTKMGDSFVAQLDTDKNSCIKQKIRLNPGKYVLKFDYATRQGSQSNSNKIKIESKGASLLIEEQFDNKEVDQFVHQFQIKKPSFDDQIEFCGEGKDDGMGVILDNIQLIYSNPC